MGAGRLIPLAVAATAAILTGCGQESSAPPAGPVAVHVTVSRDYGEQTIVAGRAAPGQSALNALRRIAEVDTSYGGRFVAGVNGLRGNRSGGHDWLYFVNGIAPDLGAAEYDLHPGDREWWDYRYWIDLVQTPIAVGAWPEPFVHGFGGKRHPVSISGPACASMIGDALRAAGAKVVDQPADYQISVLTFAQAGTTLSDWQGLGLTVSLKDGAVMVYRGKDGLQELAEAKALIAGYQPRVAPGDGVRLVVAGATEQGACAAAETLAASPDELAGAYAVALDANGNVLAAGGRT
ncbi:MAG: hypothetical protein QOJ13_2588 [Gaiellales bacterium]|nr:hypothetical protein [Gaiellales bacterium]